MSSLVLTNPLSHLHAGGSADVPSALLLKYRTGHVSWLLDIYKSSDLATAAPVCGRATERAQSCLQRLLKLHASKIDQTLRAESVRKEYQIQEDLKDYQEERPRP